MTKRPNSDPEWCVEHVADECRALIVDGDVGPGDLVAHMQEAADHVRAYRFDEARASLDAAEGHITKVLAYLDAVERGEEPEWQE